MIVLEPTKANCRIVVAAWSVRGVVVTVTASGNAQRWVSTVLNTCPETVPALPAALSPAAAAASAAPSAAAAATVRVTGGRMRPG